MAKLVLAVSVLACLWLSGCSTVEGIGKDIKSLGGTLEKEAQTEKAK